MREQPTIEVMKRAYYLFNWATIQSYKWKFNKGDPPDVRTLVTVTIMVMMMVMIKMMMVIILLRMMRCVLMKIMVNKDADAANTD